VKGITAVTLASALLLRAAQPELGTPIRVAAPHCFASLAQAGVATGAAQ